MKKLYYIVLTICSISMALVLGAMVVHSAQLQTTSSSLSVTFSGQNVNYEVQGWYHIHGGNRTELVDNDNDNDNIVRFSATEAPTVKTLQIDNESETNKATLTSEHPYVLFTYKFINTASSGAFAMNVSLNITPSPTNMKAIKYGSGSELYAEANLDTFKGTLIGVSTFSNDLIVAGGTSGATTGDSVKYYYILLEINDLTLPVNFNPTFAWTVECSNQTTVTISGNSSVEITDTQSAEFLVDKNIEIVNSSTVQLNICNDIGSANTNMVVSSGELIIDCQGGHSISNINITVGSNGSLTLKNHASIEGDIIIDGGSAILENVILSGDITISGGSSEFTNSQIIGNLIVSDGSAELGNTSIIGDLNISGGDLTNNNCNIIGDVVIEAGNTLFNNSSINGNLTVSGAETATLSGDNSNITGNISADLGSLTIYGGTYKQDPSLFANIPTGYEVRTINYNDMTLYRVVKKIEDINYNV